MLKQLIGKTIKDINLARHCSEDICYDEGYEGCHDHLVVTFDDGVKLEIISWDYEGHHSGFDFEINGEKIEE